MNTNNSNKQLKMWKYLWDVFIADKVFRQFFSNVPSYDLTLNNRSPLTTNKGTLYIPPKTKRDPEGHFIAYEKVGSNIHIFDSSAYAYQQFQNNPELERLVANRSGKNVKKLNIHPQDVCPGDTFCQTWSLGWLRSNLRHLTENVNSKNMAINSMYELIRRISHSKLFVQYMTFQKNRVPFNRIIRRAAVKFKIPVSTVKIKNVRDFVLFSQKIQKEDVARIMLDRV